MEIYERILVRKYIKKHSGYTSLSQWIKLLAGFSVGDGFKLPHPILTAEHGWGILMNKGLLQQRLKTTCRWS